MILFLLELLLVELLERRRRRALEFERARGRAWAQGVRDAQVTGS